MNKILKVLAISLCALTLVVGSIATTLAYLSMKTDSKQNTFTAGDVNITLTQTNAANEFTLVPGKTYAVDPKVTVAANSVDCWLFIKIDETLADGVNFADYLTYGVIDGWTELENGVYYRKVTSSNADQSFGVIASNTVTAVADRTKAEYNALSSKSFKLDFTAYAIQADGFGAVEAAWAEAKTLG